MMLLLSVAQTVFKTNCDRRAFYFFERSDRDKLLAVFAGPVGFAVLPMQTQPFSL